MESKRMRVENGSGEPRRVLNFIDGKVCEGSTGEWIPVESPGEAKTVAQVTVSSKADVEKAVAAANAAFPAWSSLTVKRRAAIMFKVHELLEKYTDELAKLVVDENGKNYAEAVASVAKGNETVEWACSLPQVCQGKFLQVSRGVTCHEVRAPLGVVGCICPFNFPVMVPMWTIPIALTAGNCVILKPSEKVPSCGTRMAEIFHEAGVPPGVFQVVQGTVEPVQALCDHNDVAAMSFVGSSKIAEIVAKRCRALNKRVVALGGAKNHLVALPDCNVPMAAQDIVASFSGCAGQRCMAASVLLTMGEHNELLKAIVDRAGALKPGQAGGEVGPVIDGASQKRILEYINDAEKKGAKVLLDGRSWADKSPGYWVGPTILLHSSADDPAMKEEIFGPVLSVYQAKNWDEAIAIENSNPYGNAASVYTSSGGSADWFTSRFRAAMLGVNIGIPVPREPFSFGGLYTTHSKYGDMDITGDGCLEFFTNRRKITTKWGPPPATATVIGRGDGAPDAADKASFVGQMQSFSFSTGQTPCTVSALAPEASHGLF